MDKVVRDSWIRELGYNYSYSLLSVAIGGKPYTYRLTGDYQYERFRVLLKYNQGNALRYLKKVGELLDEEE
jgi:hypothetical protein